MSKVLVIGCGGVASVAISKCCQVSDVFTELCIASRTKSKCDALAAKLAPHHPDQNHHRAGRVPTTSSSCATSSTATSPTSS
mgnify:CR=1 FL=1